MKPLLLILLCVGCFKGPVPTVVPMKVKPVPPILLAERIASADGYIVGTIVSLEADWTYDDPCGLLMAALHQCTGTVTYSFRVEGNGVGKWLWTFVPSYGYLPLMAGMDATFIYRHIYAFKYKFCKEAQGVTQGYCPADRLPSVLDSLDVVPRADSALVAHLFQTRGR